MKDVNAPVWGLIPGLCGRNVDTICTEPPRGVRLHCPEHWQVPLIQLLVGASIDERRKKSNSQHNYNSTPANKLTTFKCTVCLLGVRIMWDPGSQDPNFLQL